MGARNRSLDYVTYVLPIAFLQFIIWGLYYAFGDYYSNLVDDFNSTYAVMGALGASTCVFMGPFLILNPWVRKNFSYRAITIAAGIMLFSTFFVSSYATQTWELFFTYGLQFGIAGAWMCLLSFYCLENMEDEQSQKISMGLVEIATGLGYAVMAIMAAYILEQGYSWRVTFRYLSISGAIFAATAVFIKDGKPKEIIERDEIDELLPSDPDELHGWQLLFSSCDNLALRLAVSSFLTACTSFVAYKFAILYCTADYVSSYSINYVTPGVMGLLHALGAAVYSWEGYREDVNSFLWMKYIQLSIFVIYFLSAFVANYAAARVTMMGIFSFLEAFIYPLTIARTVKLLGDEYQIDNTAVQYTIMTASTLIGSAFAGYVYDYTNDDGENYAYLFLFCSVFFLAAFIWDEIFLSAASHSSLFC